MKDSSKFTFDHPARTRIIVGWEPCFHATTDGPGATDMAKILTLPALVRPRPRGLVLARRGLVGLGGAVIAAGALGMPRRALASSCAFTCGGYCADPTGQNDSSPAFQAALNSITPEGAAFLNVPVGRYRLDTPLTSQNSSVTVVGAGQASTVFLVTHKGTAWTHTCNSNSQSVTIRDIGFSPTPNGGGAGGTAIALVFPAAGSGWSHSSIENVDLGVAEPGYTVFAGGLSLTNAWRVNVRNLNGHSNIGNVTGSYFVGLNGECIDNRFNNCSVDGVDTAFAVNAYSEGLHLSDCVLIGNRGISTGTTSYSGNGKSSPLINLLGLYVSNCEINCEDTAGALFQVCSGWLDNTHFGSQTASQPALSLLGCTNLQVSECGFTGETGSGGLPFIGVYLGASSSQSGTWNSTSNQLDGCEFVNVLTGIEFGPGSVDNTATAIRMLAYGEGSLIGAPVKFGNGTMQAVLDTSGNSTNNAQWLSSLDASNSKSGRFLYSQP
jgi:hypothetical protein